MNAVPVHGFGHDFFDCEEGDGAPSRCGLEEIVAVTCGLEMRQGEEVSTDLGTGEIVETSVWNAQIVQNDVNDCY